jgi:hypothetical protein
MAQAIAFLAAGLLLCSCGGVYRYRLLDRQDYVLPPGSRDAQPSAPAIRDLGRVAPACAVQSETLTIRVRNRRGSAHLAPVEQDAPGRVTLPIAKDLEAVRAHLSGCPGGTELLQRLPYLLPMSSRATRQLLYGSFSGTGVLDIQAPHVLRYLAPDGDRVVTARYRALPSGGLERFAGPPTPVDGFIRGHSRFRLLFLTFFSSADHKEILVRGADAGAVDSCRSDPSGPDCLQLDRGAAIAPEIPVSVDGELRYVPVDASAGEAAAGRRILSIRRGPRRQPVRWDPAQSPSRLALLGGEILTTQKPPK